MKILNLIIILTFVLTSCSKYNFNIDDDDYTWVVDFKEFGGSSFDIYKASDEKFLLVGINNEDVGSVYNYNANDKSLIQVDSFDLVEAESSEWKFDTFMNDKIVLIIDFEDIDDKYVFKFRVSGKLFEKKYLFESDAIILADDFLKTKNGYLVLYNDTLGDQELYQFLPLCFRED